MVVQPYRLEQQKAAAEKLQNNVPMSYVKEGANVYLTLKDGSKPSIKELLYTGSKEVLHTGGGFGIHVIMNENFNISFEFAKTLRKQDGLFGMNIGLNYIF